MTLASLSSFIERVGPDKTVSGNLCGPGGNAYCYTPTLKGGFPLPYLFDKPGVSVPGQLSIVEDHFRAMAFGLDVGIYLVVLWVLRQSLRPVRPAAR